MHNVQEEEEEEEEALELEKAAAAAAEDFIGESSSTQDDDYDLERAIRKQVEKRVEKPKEFILNPSNPVQILLLSCPRFVITKTWKGKNETLLVMQL